MRMLQVLLISLLFLFSADGKSETGHYVNGIEGIKAATIPGEGWYYRLYNIYYQADQLTDPNGDAIAGLNFDAEVRAMAHRLIRVTDTEILGGRLFWDVVLPVIDTELDVGGQSFSDASFGDFFIEPFGLTWHGKQWDYAAAIGFYLPTGSYSPSEPASAGKDFYTMMISSGGTWYFDEQKSWSASILARYETHSDKKDLDYEPGDDFHFEWGIGKSFSNFWEVGLIGYAQWQLNVDKGDDVSEQQKAKDEVFAVGFEVNKFMPEMMLNTSLKVLTEFGAEDRSEGDVVSLTFTKIF